jgi:phosphoglycolate phosphatase-like HAD superfamily hydrolase
VKLNEIKNQEFKIFLDLDGVMADFKRGVREILKLPANAPKNEIFAALSKGAKDFFLRLPKTKDADRLWAFLKKNDLEILTGVPTTNREEAAKNKVQWVRRNLSKNVKVNTTSSRSKKKFAAPNHILIDDRADNIADWKAAGGIGILHISTAKTIKELKKLGIK